MEYSDGDRASSSPLFSLFGTAVMIPYLALFGVLVAIVLYFSNVLPAQYVLEKVNDVISKVIDVRITPVRRIRVWSSNYAAHSSSYNADIPSCIKQQGSPSPLARIDGQMDRET